MPASGIKYSLDFTLNERAPSRGAFAKAISLMLPSLAIIVSKSEETVSLLSTCNSIASLNAMFLLLRIVLIPDTT